MIIWNIFNFLFADWEPDTAQLTMILYQVLQRATFSNGLPKVLPAVNSWLHKKYPV